MTLWMQPNDQAEVGVVYSFEFNCCNLLEQCAVGTFTIETINPLVTKKFPNHRFHVQYDSTRDVTEAFTWVLTDYQYEELNSPDKSSGLTEDHYETSDHYAVWKLGADYSGDPDYFDGTDMIGLYYG